MGEIVDLRDFVPDDITFVFNDGEWSIPGDIDSGTVWELYTLLLDVADLNLDEEQPSTAAARRELGKIRKIDSRIQDILLRLFQARHPDLEALPLGTRASRLVTQELLRQVGFLVEPEPEEEPAGDPTTGKPRRRSGSSTTGSSRS